MGFESLPRQPSELNPHAARFAHAHIYSCAEISRHPAADRTLKRAKARAPERGIHAASTVVVLGAVESFMRAPIAAEQRQRVAPRRQPWVRVRSREPPSGERKPIGRTNFAA